MAIHNQTMCDTQIICENIFRVHKTCNYTKKYAATRN